MFSSGQTLYGLRSAVSASQCRRPILLRRAASSASGATSSASSAPETADAAAAQSSESRLRPAAAAVDTDFSRLRSWHRRKYHGQPPLVDDETQHLRGLRVQRRLWALYGRQAGVSAAVGWPVREEWADKMEYEALAMPDSLQQMVERFHAEQRDQQAAIDERMRAIDANMANLEKWKRDIVDKKKKKEEQIRIAEEKRAKLIAEVKDIVGFRVDPKDEKFKKVLEEKELEERKLLREAKKREKQRKQLEQLRAMTEQAAAAAASPPPQTSPDDAAAPASGTSAAAADTAAEPPAAK